MLRVNAARLHAGPSKWAPQWPWELADYGWRGVDGDTLKRLTGVPVKPTGATDGFLSVKRIACPLTGAWRQEKPSSRMYFEYASNFLTAIERGLRAYQTTSGLEPDASLQKGNA